MTCHALQTQLTPYLDGELVDEARLSVESHLVACQACSRQLEVERHNLSLLRSLARQGAPPAPERLRREVFSRIDRDGRRATMVRAGWLGAAAAGVALVAVAGTHEYRSHQLRLYEEDAALRHARKLPLEIEQQGPAAIEAWFSGKLDHRVALPHFLNARAAGARILQVRDKPAALIRYDQGSHPMSLFVFPDSEAAVGAEPAVGSSHGFNVVSWRDGEVVYQLVTELSLADIRELLEPRAGERPTVIIGPALEAQPAALRR
jgi:anti-sigma factor RsiW